MLLITLTVGVLVAGLPAGVPRSSHAQSRPTHHLRRVANHGGGFNAIAAEGDRVVASVGTRLLVFDAAAPVGSPPLTELDLGWQPATDLALVDGWAYALQQDRYRAGAARVTQLLAIDLGGTVPTITSSTLLTIGATRLLSVGDRLLAVAGSEALVLDLARPARPAQVARSVLPAPARSLRAHGDRLALGDGLQNHVWLLSVNEQGAIETEGQWDTEAPPRDVDRGPSEVVSISPEGLSIAGRGSPSDPWMTVGELGFDRLPESQPPWSLTLAGDRAWIIAEDGWICAVDVSDPAMPDLQWQDKLPTRGPDWGMIVSERGVDSMTTSSSHVWFMDHERLMRVHRRDPARAGVEVVHTSTRSSRAAVAVEDGVWIVDGSGHLAVVPNGGRMRPVEWSGQRDAGIGSTTALAIHDDRLYHSLVDGSLEESEILSFGRLREVRTVPFPYGPLQTLHANADLLAGSRVFYPKPWSFELSTGVSHTMNSRTQTLATDLDGRRLWAWGFGLAAYELRGGLRPVTLLDDGAMWNGALLQAGDIDGDRAAFLSSSFAGTASTPSGLVVADVSDPAEPAIISQLELGSVLHGLLRLEEDRAWIAWASGFEVAHLSVVDLFPTDAPEELVLEPLGISALGVLAVSGDRAWIQRGPLGLDELLLLEGAAPTPMPSASPAPSTATAPATVTATTATPTATQNRPIPPVLLPYARR